MKVLLLSLLLLLSGCAQDRGVFSGLTEREEAEAKCFRYKNWSQCLEDVRKAK